MPDTRRNGKLPPKDVVDIHRHITSTCEYFIGVSDMYFRKLVIAEVDAAPQIDVDFVLLAAIGTDVINHVRAGGGFILTEPLATQSPQPKGQEDG